MSTRLLLASSIFTALTAQGQTLMEGSTPGARVQLMPSDGAVLENRDPRKDIPCSLRNSRAELGFDLAFHSGYEVTVPLRDLAESGNRLTIIFRVTPEGRSGEPVYFMQKWTVPTLDHDAKGSVYLHGDLVLGEGEYQVDWLMRDLGERFCSTNWRISAATRGKDQRVELSMMPGTVKPESTELFGEEAPVKRDPSQPLHVLVLLHVAPRNIGSAVMPPVEAQALVSILRSIAREPRIGTYSVAAFNMEQREVLYRSDAVPQIDFPALGAAIKQLRLGAIDVRKLGNNDGGMQFLAGLVNEEMAANRPDAVIFVGVKTSFESTALRSSIKDLGEPRRAFYLTYNADPVADPWRDAIGSVVKLWRGFEYTISKPRDLLVAWAEVMARIPTRDSASGVSAPNRGTISGLVPKK